MEKQNYCCSIIVNITAKEAFDGINNVSAWWAENVEGGSRYSGDVFTTRFGETFGTFEVTEFIPYEKITWLNMECYLDLLKNKTEWKDTKIVWQIAEAHGTTKISMEHVGLVPGIECYEDCKKGWDFYIKESLLQFLTKAKGLPGTGIRTTISSNGRIYEGTLFSKNSITPNYEGEYLYVDVKETKVEHVVAAYSVDKFDRLTFDAAQLKGDYFMMVTNKPVYGQILPIDDLVATLQ